MTKYALAKKLGVSRQAVGAWYLGKAFPSTKNLIKLSALWKMSVDDVIKVFTGKK